ncbi:uncharacterized protein EAE98_012024 [Botrytis deweyae]|uniref:BTB domain-containing protein n=1 Tax=Botrytis deweyae TaxID=2478750 RepID=A0ABQ7I494_9HELO|nr:uncharacterized protein EAE98_012024 [Botrytis deweyae]KAF7910492.1 hypothetical protein EAE98_012024 [Botrytis deweyae]
MAAPSSSIVIIDPDGDLVLLLGPVPLSKSDASTSNPRIDVPNTNILSPKAPNNPGETQNECTQLSRSEVLVSSKHLSFASPVFKAMLTGDFREAVELREKGRTEIPLPDDDADAMITLVNVIHGRFNSVSKYPNLILLTKIAILVDKYQCHESTKFVAKVWAANDHLPRIWSQEWYNIACWICVAWVFRLDHEFRDATEEIIKESGVGLGAILKENDLALPIPERIISKIANQMKDSRSLTRCKDKIDESRENAVSQLIKFLKDTISRYQGHTLMCPSQSLRRVLDIISHRETCDATVLGSLIKGATEKGLFPFPEVPFNNELPFSVVKRSIESLEPRTACNVVVQVESLHHDVLERIRQSIEFIDEKISGLSLADCE